MKLNDNQKKIIGFAVIGAVVYFIYNKTKPPKLQKLKQEEKLIQYLYDYFNSLSWQFSLDNGAYIKPYVTQIETLSPKQLQNLVNYYIDNYKPSTGINKVSDWIDDQYYTLLITNEPFQSTINYLKNLGL